MDSLAQIGVFAAEAFTIFIVLALLIILVALMATKASHKNEIEITRLDEKFKKTKSYLNNFLMSKEDLKELNKTEKKNKKSDEAQEASKKKLFFVNFEGDMKASAVEHLREEITAILTVATPKDEVVVNVESPGGVVHGYGLAASQLNRLREHQIPLTVCVDKVAASGGYLMSCTANKILAAPFAIIGSIGVVAQVPNFHQLLKKNNIQYKEYTAGEFKRTVSILGEITEKGEEKFVEQLEATHVLFKSFVQKFRTQLDLQKVATGEYWYGEQALILGLVDEISTSDDYLMKKSETHKIIQVKHETQKSLSDKISQIMGSAVENTALKIWANFENRKWL